MTVRACDGCRKHRPREEFDDGAAVCRACAVRREKNRAAYAGRVEKRRAAALKRVTPDMRVRRRPAPGWETRARCTPADAAEFDGDGTPEGRALCAACPVARSCLEDALETNPDPEQQVGYQGRRKPDQRADILYARTAPAYRLLPEAS
ncbi:WhiB family transcriptional regulator [Streptomycetaceae bacterium NBC_01309]